MGLFRARRQRPTDDEIARELRDHLELEAEELATAGDAGEAHARARRRFGNPTLVAESVRAVWRRSWLEQADSIAQDLRYAARSLRRTSRFAFTVVFTLMLGLGLNGALFSALDRVFLRAPTGVPAPGALKRLYYHRPNHLGPFSPSNRVYSAVPYPEYEAIRGSISDRLPVGAYIEPREITADVSGAVVTVMRSYASRSYIDVCGVTPRIGRLFSADEDRVDFNSRVQRDPVRAVRSGGDGTATPALARRPAVVRWFRGTGSDRGDARDL